MITCNEISSCVSYSSFSTESGTEEFFATIKPESLNVEKAFVEMMGAYQSFLDKLDLSTETQVFSRLYVSDLQNQKSFFLSSSLYQTLSSSAFSVIEQEPLDSSLITLLVYHVKSPKNLERSLKFHDEDRWRNSLTLKGDNYSMLWTANYDGRGEFDSGSQTDELLNAIDHQVASNNMTLLGNSIRTWIYVRDIDNHYKGMVDNRRVWFEKHNLTASTRYLASTGIEGRGRNVDTLVTIDSLSYSNLKPEQIIRMEALSHLSPTISYGVTFERGLRVQFGDRSHLFISGTASIDSEGKIVHEEDIYGQTLRTLENIDALLRPHNATLDDLNYLLIYLRNPKHLPLVKDLIASRCSDSIPYLILRAAVCRPGWLIEMEGEALVPSQAPYPDFI